MRHRIAAIAIVFSTFATARSAVAQTNGLPFQATYVQQYGTGSPTTTFDVWLRLKNVSGKDFNFDQSNIAGGFGLGDLLPIQGYKPSTQSYADFASYTGAYVYSWQGCGGFFQSNCSSGPYTLIFGDGLQDNFGMVTFADGEERDAWHSSYIPVGNAPSGRYVSQPQGYGVNVSGLDVDGDEISATFDIARACEWNSPDCFTRDVVSGVVPEPGTYALMAVGLAGLGYFSRRRQRSA